MNLWNQFQLRLLFNVEVFELFMSLKSAFTNLRLGFDPNHNELWRCSFLISKVENQFLEVMSMKLLVYIYNLLSLHT